MQEQKVCGAVRWSCGDTKRPAFCSSCPSVLRHVIREKMRLVKAKQMDRISRCFGGENSIRELATESGAQSISSTLYSWLTSAQEYRLSSIKGYRYPSRTPVIWPHSVIRDSSNEAASIYHCQRRPAGSGEPANMACSIQGRAGRCRCIGAIWR